MDADYAREAKGEGHGRQLGIVLQNFSKVDRYHIILQNLLQNFSYLHWMGITILAKDRTYPVQVAKNGETPMLYANLAKGKSLTSCFTCSCNRCKGTVPMYC